MRSHARQPLPADAAGGHCAAMAVTVRDVGSPLRKRDLKVARENQKPTLLGNESVLSAKPTLLGSESVVSANFRASAVDLKSSVLSQGRSSLISPGRRAGGGDCGGGPEARTGPSFHLGGAVDSIADALPKREAGELPIEALLRSLASEPYETVFADPPAKDEHLCIRNLNTGELRHLDPEAELTESFMGGELPSARRITRGLATPWQSWWAQKRTKDSILFSAAESGDVTGVQAALQAPTDGRPPASANACCPGGRAALHAAAAGGHEDVVKVLLQAEANVHAVTDKATTALHAACGRGHGGVARLLLVNGADARSTAADGNLAIHLAAMGGHLDAMSALLKHSGSQQLRVRNHMGQLPVEAAINKEAVEVCRRHDDKLASDTYTIRTPFQRGAPLLRNCRADAVQRLLCRTRQLATAAEAEESEGPSLSGAGPHPSSSPESSRGALGHRTPHSLGARTPHSSGHRSFGVGGRTPRTPGASPSVRGPFVRIRSDGQTAERVGPNSFELVKLLGRGAFGEVFQVKHKRAQEVYAMKVLQKSKILSKNLQRYAMTERNILAYVRHPYIVQLHYAFQTTSHLVLVLQYCPLGNLQALISREKRLQEPIAQLYTAEILMALCHLHERKTVFRDLKPDNVVLDEARHAMLTDFGLSKEGVGDRGTRSFCGSVAFLAPEILLRRQHGHTVDVYNLGVLLFDMLTGLPPFYHHDRETLFANIRHARLEIPRYVPPQAKALIETLMMREPSRRLGHVRTTDIQSHPYFATLDFSALMRRELPVPAVPSGADTTNEVALRVPSPILRGGTPESPFARPERATGRRAASGGAAGAGAGSIPDWEFTALPSPPPPRQASGTPARTVSLRLPGVAAGGGGGRRERARTYA